ncbi:MAG: hypothetical protein WBK55_01390 [Alphaproteobacteria bacterium]
MLVSVPASAEQTLILDKMDNSIVSGPITRVDGESLFINYSGREIEVQLDDLDVDEKNISNLFAPGMNITAKGVFDEDGDTPVMDAKEVIRADADGPGPETILLSRDND